MTPNNKYELECMKWNKMRRYVNCDNREKTSAK